MIAKIKQFGLIYSVIRGIKKVLRIIGLNKETYLLYVKNSGVNGNSPKLDDKYRVAEINNIGELINSKFNFSSKKIDIFKCRLNQNGYRCFAVMRDNRIVYYCWVSSEKFESPGGGGFKKLEESQGLLLDAMCHSSERGSGIHTYMNYYRCKHLFDLGKKEALVLILRENIPAIRSQENVGFRFLEKLTFVSVFGKRYVTISK